MKKKIIALICALALTLSLAGCVISTPDTVGSIGDVEITSGLYLLAQFNAYQSAASLADSDTDTTSAKSFLKATITTDSDTGDTAVVSDYVAEKTLENLETYAAIETRFDELGGTLTDDEETQADDYADQLMEQNGDLYNANGIGLETLKRFARIIIKSNDLLDMVYGTDGETPVSDADLTNYIENNMYEIGYYVVPLYNSSTFAFADDDQITEMVSLAQAAADSANASAQTSVSAQVSTFTAAAESALPDVYAVLDSEYTSTGIQTELLSDSDFDSFTVDGADDTLRSLEYGKAAAFQYSSYAMMLAIRLDPLAVNSLSSIRSDALSAMKSDELSDSFITYGASLENNLSSSAMSKMPAKKIVASVSSDS